MVPDFWQPFKLASGPNSKQKLPQIPVSQHFPFLLHEAAADTPCWQSRGCSETWGCTDWFICGWQAVLRAHWGEVWCGEHQQRHRQQMWPRLVSSSMLVIISLCVHGERVYTWVGSKIRLEGQGQITRSLKREEFKSEDIKVWWNGRCPNPRNACMQKWS